MSEKGIDWDWTIGSFIQFTVFFLVIYNIILYFMNPQWIYGVLAGCYCFWFIFAPWCLSEYPAFVSEPFRYHSSIYAAIQHHRLMKKYGIKQG